MHSLTMRSLAKKLGIQAASLYWHMRSKQDLLSLLAEESVRRCANPTGRCPGVISWRN